MFSERYMKENEIATLFSIPLQKFVACCGEGGIYGASVYYLSLFLCLCVCVCVCVWGRYSSRDLGYDLHITKWKSSITLVLTK